MKKTIFKTLLLISILAVMFVSCKKQEQINNPNNQKIEANMIDSEPSFWDQEYWHDNGFYPGEDGVDFGCWDKPGECLPEVVITGAIAEKIEGLSSEIDNGNQSEIIRILSDNYEDFNSILISSSLDELINGEYTISYRGSNKPGEKIYLIIKDSNGDIVNVYPVQM